MRANIASAVVERAAQAAVRDLKSPAAPVVSPQIADGSQPVSVLFARADSVYKTLPGCDVWDIDRDARGYAGPSPVICHPPCRAWGKLASFSHPRAGERDLALFALECVRRYGGVLEHPVGSALWPQYFLPRPGQLDLFGGWTWQCDQFEYGHLMHKLTRLYIVGPQSIWLPPPPEDARAGLPRLPRYLSRLTVKQREATPIEFAAALVALARGCAGYGDPQYRFRMPAARHVRAYKKTRHAAKGERKFATGRVAA